MPQDARNHDHILIYTVYKNGLRGDGVGGGEGMDWGRTIRYTASQLAITFFKCYTLWKEEIVGMQEIAFWFLILGLFADLNFSDDLTR
jgi:hypothetical protein